MRYKVLVLRILMLLEQPQKPTYFLFKRLGSVLSYPRVQCYVTVGCEACLRLATLLRSTDGSFSLEADRILSYGETSAFNLNGFFSDYVSIKNNISSYLITKEGEKKKKKKK